jgi:hypothetical protein
MILLLEKLLLINRPTVIDSFAFTFGSFTHTALFNQMLDGGAAALASDKSKYWLAIVIVVLFVAAGKLFPSRLR